MGRAISVEVGEKYNMLTVIGVERERRPDGKVRAIAVCRCECGKEKRVIASGLRNGGTKSCGCHRAKSCGDRFRTHGEGNKSTRLYRIWCGIRSRCFNSSDQHFKDYGGRGVGLCDEWSESYEAFRDWAKANGYTRHRSIDRIDNDGNYTTENCRWATQKEQCNNRRLRSRKPAGTYSKRPVQVGDKFKTQVVQSLEWKRIPGQHARSIAVVKCSVCGKTKKVAPSTLHNNGTGTRCRCQAGATWLMNHRE